MSQDAKIRLQLAACFAAEACAEAVRFVNDAVGTSSIRESLPTVLKVIDGQFVIDQQGASAAAIRQTVAACPSGALQITDD